MFERYTERARRVIFFARYEASRYGSTTIETEHMLLGLIRENQNSVAKLVREGAVDKLSKAIAERSITRERVSTSADLPLTDESKRILAYANEEAERLSHRFIGTEHLLLGMLREPSTLACQLLREHGADIDRFREELAKSSPRLMEGVGADGPSANRESVRELLDRLPEETLGMAQLMMERMLGGPGPRPLMTTSSGGSMRRGPEGQVTDGRFTSSHTEDGVLVIESKHLYRGHRIVVTERLNLSEDGKTLVYSQNVEGPKQERHTQSIQFDVSE